MFKSLLKSTRIGWASKTLNMFLLALSYAYFSGLIIKNPFEVLGGLILVCLLWGALYSLNDYTDIESDRSNPEKQDRAFVQDKVDKKSVYRFIVILIILVFIISIIFYSLLFTLILGLMLLNQILYTVPPFRLKNTILAPFTSTATNSVLRTASCCVLLGNLFIVPLPVYFFLYFAGMGTYSLYKSKKTFSQIIVFLGIITLGYIFYMGEMNLIQFSVAILPSIIAAIPLYLSLYFNKDKMMQLSDVIYHQVALVFFSIIILYLLFIV
ncbi:MAG: UbiA family prenyltransferase [Methanobacterium sp.]|jgi:4-hydroxybenzoate polyprenyltransferase